MFFRLMFMSFHGIMEVLVIGILGYIIIAGLKSGQDYMDFLSKLLVRITLPCLVFSNLASSFDPGKIELWWIFPLLAISINIVGTIIGSLYVRMDRTIQNRGEFITLVAFQNGIFLPLAFAPVLFGPDKLPYFLTLIFLYNLLQVPTFFTLAVWLVNSDAGIGQRLKSVINPPNIATVFGLFFVFTGLNVYIPEWIVRPVTTVGSMSAPLSTLYVGGVIVSNLMKARPETWGEPVKATILKCLVCPVIASLIVYMVRPPEYVALFIIMESVMPSALMIALITPPEEAKQKIVAGVIVLTSLVSIFTIPFFMGIYGALYW
ncbi:AEC family transporter [bacterium]|nr:AEC family transporter [bacterium]